MPLSFHVQRQTCQALSTSKGCVANDVPSRRAWTVVPDGQLALPYHSTRSTSPPRTGSLFSSHHAGQHPNVRQSNFTRASQVRPMPPRQLPVSLPPKYLSFSFVARMTKLDLPSRNTFLRSLRYWPMFSGRSQNTGFLIISRAVEMVHFDGSGAEPAGPSNSSWKRKLGVAVCGGGTRGGGCGRIVRTSRGALLGGIRFYGRDPTRPFVDVVAHGFDDLDALARCVRDEWSMVTTRFARLRARPGSIVGPRVLLDVSIHVARHGD